MTSTIPRLHVGCGTTVGALTTFPVWSEGPTVDGLDWLGSGLAVAEVPGGAEVERLDVRNDGDQPAVVLSGDLLEGGLQHRMAVTTSLLLPGAAATLLVRCVEHGRWSGSVGHRTTGRRAGYGVANADRRADGNPAQEAVWDRIRTYERTLGSTPSESLIDHLDRDTRTTTSPLEGQRGVIIGIGGRVLALEIFGSSEGFAARWPGILAGARLDAAGAPPVPTQAEAARRFIRTVATVRLEARPPRAGSQRAVGGRVGSVTLAGLLVRPGTGIHLGALDTAHPILAAA